MNGIRPVSYTHLDVYKRQVFIFYREKMLDLTGMQSAEQLNSILDMEIEGLEDSEELIAVAYK